MEKVLFSEEQKMKRWKIWLVLTVPLLAVLVPLGYGIYSQENLNKPFGDHPQNTTELIISLAISVFIIGLIVFVISKMTLKTKINTEGIWVAFPPLMRKWKRISPEEIGKYEIRTYRAKLEYGGYGIKRRRRSGRALIIAGNTGLQIYFKSGKKLLIGTQKKQALEYAMEKLMQKEK